MDYSTENPQWVSTDRIEKDEIENVVTRKSVIFAKAFADYLTEGENKEKLPTNQLRKFYSEVKRIQMIGYDENTYADFLLLQPKLAYAVGRANKQSKINDFYNVLVDGINTVNATNKDNRVNAFNNFIKIFESIVAYHKYYETEKKQQTTLN